MRGIRGEIVFVGGVNCTTSKTAAVEALAVWIELTDLNIAIRIAKVGNLQ